MSEMTASEVKRLDMRTIGKIFREAARKERAHESITVEYGNDLINIIAVHGDRLADAVGLFFHAERPAAALSSVIPYCVNAAYSPPRFSLTPRSLPRCPKCLW
jgi:hypothetical protein